MMVVAGSMRKRSDTVFEADFTTATPGVISLVGYGLAYSRLSGAYSVRTGTSTVMTGGTLSSADIPTVGRRLDTDLPGLVNEEARTNFIPSSRVLSNAGGLSAGTGTFTDTANYGVGPDGLTLADRGQCNANSLCSYFVGLPTGFSTLGATVSIWHMAGSGGGLGAAQADGGIGSVSKLLYAGSEPGTWAFAYADVSWGGVNSSTFYRVNGYDSTGLSGGIAAGARDTLQDMMSFELGHYPTEHIITAGAGSVTRAAPKISRTLGSTLLAADGSMRFYAEIYPSGSSSQYSSDLELWYDSANNHAEIDHTTAQVKVTIGGTLYTTPAAMTWARGDILRIWCAAGGSVVTEVKYDVNTNSPQVLSTGSPPTFGAITVSGVMDLFNANKTNIFSGIIRRFRTYKVGRKPVTF